MPHGTCGLCFQRKDVTPYFELMGPGGHRQAWLPICRGCFRDVERIIGWLEASACQLQIASSQGEVLYSTRRNHQLNGSLPGQQRMPAWGDVGDNQSMPPDFSQRPDLERLANRPQPDNPPTPADGDGQENDSEAPTAATERQNGRSTRGNTRKGDSKSES